MVFHFYGFLDFRILDFQKKIIMTKLHKLFLQDVAIWLYFISHRFTDFNIKI